MAIFMATTKSISRGNGQSAVASASYRAGEKLQDLRYGKTQDYSKRHGVMSADIILPSELTGKVTIDRNTLWNMAEQVEKRKDSRVAREWIINLPHELDEPIRKELAHNFTQQLADKYGVIADCCIHRPTEKEIERGADPRNFHAHIMLTTRQAQLSAEGDIVLGNKATIELSDSKRRSIGLGRVNAEIVEIRELWERTANEKLAEYGHQLIDSRSYHSQGIDIVPQLKVGKNATQMERDGIATPVGDINRLIKERNELVFNREIADIEKNHQRADDIIIKHRQAHQKIPVLPPVTDKPKTEFMLERTQNVIQPLDENLATLVPIIQEKTSQRENRPPSVDEKIVALPQTQNTLSNSDDWRLQYEAWKAQKNSPANEQTTQPLNDLQAIGQSAMSKYEQWKADKALAEQQAQVEAERQRQLELEQRKIKPSPTYDNDRGFSL